MFDSTESQIDPHHKTGYMLLFIAMVFFIIGIFSAIFRTSSSTAWLGVASLITGLIGFKQLEYTPPIEKEIPLFFNTELLDATLRSGQAIQVHFEISYRDANNRPHAMKQIGSRLQRELNIYATTCDHLSPDPYGEFDNIAQKFIAQLADEVGVQNLKLKTVRVITGDAPMPPTAGFHMRP
jgi:hypothetical protein